jgi:alpha-glucoside transport system substrate-binding protein
VALSVAALLLAACASNTETPAASIDEDALSTAEEAALEAAGGERIGGEVTVVGVNGGVEGEIIEATFQPFEEATGIDVVYQGTSDANTVVQTGVAAGNPPDVFNAANAGALPGYAQAGALVPLDDLFDRAELEEQFGTALLESATVDGSLYGIWNEVDNFMLWYNADTYEGPDSPESWDEVVEWSTAEAQAEGGPAPWCMGLESGAASGVPGAHFISNLILRAYGPEVVAQLAAGELPFTSPEVEDGFRMFGEIATQPEMVEGGPTGVLATRTVDAGNGLFSDPQRCQLLGWGNYAAGLITAANPTVTPGENLDFFRYPAIEADYANSEMVSGHVMYAFNDTPQVRAFMRYYASPEAQALLASSGQWVVGNRDVPLDTYPNEISRRAAEQYLDSEEVVLAPVSQLPAPIVLEFYRSVVAYVQDPSSLDSVLATLEAKRLEVIGG